MNVLVARKGTVSQGIERRCGDEVKYDSLRKAINAAKFS
ncbi:hypothetical protein THTE_2097 [Thermogutta terrifontis]|uniref:Uncharacterized protein n=1 Tax=Thermogutta terrifontis TaxID=1331910 RepID=A0A286RFG0_9BACT|nr:hypothetical protein THTE_2097 [Thermogutta terrifontis]